MKLWDAATMDVPARNLNSLLLLQIRCANCQAGGEDTITGTCCAAACMRLPPGSLDYPGKRLAG